jgi:hypothetical protein
MTVSQYFKTSSYCLIGSGFAAIASTGAVGWISIFLFSAIFAASWFVDTVRLRQRIPNWALNCLALLYLPVFVIDHRLLSHSFMAAILHLLLFTAAVKLFTLSKDRDFVLLYLISFAELLAASTLTVNILFILCFLVFLFSAIGTLILFEMRRSNARVQGESTVQPLVVPKKLRGTGLELFAPFPAGLMSASVAGITLFIIACAIPLFLLLPRVTPGLYRQPSGATQFISGFSDRVELGQIGTIKQSAATVMRVKTDRPPSKLPSDIKWRGISFDYYDGRSWSRSDQARYGIPEQGWYYKLEDSIQGTDLVNQTFFVEALSTNVVFAMQKVLAVSKDVGFLQRDSAGNLYTGKHLQRKIRYSAVSDPIRPDPSKVFDAAQTQPQIARIYLQLPSRDPRIEELAKRATKGVESRYGKALALEAFLRTNYTYSLVLRGTPKSTEPLAMFLFDVRKGHCEYFASAMAVMLREIGIPARLVNGFRSGEYNQIGNNWIVRQYDAHSWVEAYFPPYGWVEFDPTPPDPQRPKTAFMRLISNLSDAIDLWWWEGVVNYDSLRQYRTLSALRARMNSFRQAAGQFLALMNENCRRAFAWLKSPNQKFEFEIRWMLWIPGIAIVILVLIKPLRKHVLDLSKRILYRSDPRAAAMSFYREALDLLSARGFKRSLEQTPLEFAESLGNHPAAVHFYNLTRIYNAVRFGPPEVSFHRSEAESLLRLLRESL